MGTIAPAHRLIHSIVCLSLAFGLQSFLAGCGAQQPQQPTKMAWPLPPDTPRVEFVRDIVTDKDLFHDTSFAQGVINFVAGSKPLPNHIVEPMGLAVSDDGQILYVSDTAWQAVFIFDFGQKKFSVFDGFLHPLGLALDGQQQWRLAQYSSPVNFLDQQLRLIPNSLCTTGMNELSWALQTLQPET